MVVARYADGHLTLVDRLREMVRLADGLTSDLLLSDDAQQLALDCLSRFGERLRSFDPNDVVAVGTNTLRRAKNGAEFLQRAKAHLGHSIDIISGLEEARLVYLGASHSVPPSSKRRLVVDIGGGSTELIVGQGFEPQRMYSLFMGCVSISRVFFPGGRISRRKLEEARLTIDQEIAPVVAPLKALGWKYAFGSSGTARAIQEVLTEVDPQATAITADGMRRLRNQLLQLKHMDEVSWNNLQERRRPVFLGGLLIMERIFDALNIESMTPTDYSLREGLLYDTLGKWSGEDARERSVRVLANKYDADPDQAQRLATIALKLFKRVYKEWHLPRRQSRQLLRWAATLHEIGLGIAHSHYHRHGGYIVANADLPGFSRNLQQRLAWLIAGHRRRVPPLPSMAAQSSWNERLPKLLAVLRIAVVIVRGRQVDDVPKIRAQVDGDCLRVRFPRGWLQKRPLTELGLKEEAEIFAALGIRMKFA
ncbi:MAG: Ppx/GppA family phosphatase [Gammaproteobacteria bacterium]|nr:Ppx/GppA family phosphatase [Gammaproteobacteria bacterium]